MHLRRGALDGGDEVVGELAHPDAVAIGEAHEEAIGLSVVIEEDAGVDTFLTAYQRLHHVTAHLPERTPGRVGRSYEEMLVGRVVHVVLTILMIDLRGPEPLLLGGILLFQCQCIQLRPSQQVFRCPHLYAVGIVGAIGIIGIAIQKDEGVGQRHDTAVLRRGAECKNVKIKKCNN